ncbi:MAG: hypothetical protein QM817_01570 [Archangium sp.]
MELAARRELKSVVGELGKLTWDVEADGYQRLQVPATADVEPLLRLLLRRGLDPLLTPILLDRFETRPVERALIAWDVAAGSLLGHEDHALLQRLRSNLSPLKQMGPAGTVAVARDRVPALLSAITSIGEQPLEGVPSLASIAQLKVEDTAGLEAALAFAQKLARAHLPSFALAIAQVLWSRLSLPAALDEAIEIGLDFERYDSIPQMAESDTASMQRQTYFLVRFALARLEMEGAAQMLEQLKLHPAMVNAPVHARLEWAKAELALLSDEPTSLGLPNVDPLWRYGARVRDAIRIKNDFNDAPWTIDASLMSFGNDMRIWADAALQPTLQTQLLALASREIRFGSHEPDAWRALAMLSDDGTPIEIELQERSAAQLAAAMA